MAISKEDKADVARAHGKALANKIEKTTRDGRAKPKKIDLALAFPGESRMDKIKARVGSDNRKVNYGAMYKSLKRHE